MSWIRIGHTQLDEAVARRSLEGANETLERFCQIVTYAADEHVLVASAISFWLLSCFGNHTQRRKAEYILLNVIASAALPHFMKRLVDQERPDRRVHGMRHGVPKSGRAYNAFPSGHAVHIGNLVSAIGLVFPKRRWVARSVGAAVAATRVLLLAHWLTDVL